MESRFRLVDGSAQKSHVTLTNDLLHTDCGVGPLQGPVSFSNPGSPWAVPTAIESHAFGVKTIPSSTKLKVHCSAANFSRSSNPFAINHTDSAR